MSEFEELHKGLKKLENEIKKIKKQMKLMMGENNEKKVNGFAKPMEISEEMLEFAGKEAGTKMGRLEVTKSITEYIKENELQNKDNKREIIMDEKLKKILKVEEGTKLTYFNLQRYISPHIKKQVEEKKEEKKEVKKEVEVKKELEKKTVKKVAKKSK